VIARRPILGALAAALLLAACTGGADKAASAQGAEEDRAFKSGGAKAADQSAAAATAMGPSGGDDFGAAAPQGGEAPATEEEEADEGYAGRDKEEAKLSERSDKRFAPSMDPPASPAPPPVSLLAPLAAGPPAGRAPRAPMPDAKPADALEPEPVASRSEALRDGLLDREQRDKPRKRKPSERRVSKKDARDEDRDGDAPDDDRRDAERDGALAPPRRGVDAAEVEVAPTSFLPRVFYFENTYLGGNAAYQERLRRLDAELAEGRRPHHLAFAAAQPTDPPESAGLGLSARLDRTSLEHPARVVLQVGLQGSARYGWRRPPLDVVLVLDAGVIASRVAASDAVTALLDRLGPRDRLGVIAVGQGPVTLADVQRVRDLQRRPDALLAALGVRAGPAPASLRAALARAGALLTAAAQDKASIPGTQTVLLVTAGADPERIAAAERAVHGLTVQGVVSSVIELGARSDAPGHWWRVANAGHGNYHRAAADGVAGAFDAELEALARVVARLIRVNIRLAKGVKAIRVLGSRVLDAEEVARVKAREKAVDTNLSKTLGVTADRGDDDDGIQTVMPYFYGGDSHVILVELWVTRPGAVADVSLRYKDMVNLDNATARTSVSLAASPREATPAAAAIGRNARGFELAQVLQRAGIAIKRGRVDQTLRALGRARQLAAVTGGADPALVAELEALVRRRANQGRGGWHIASEALLLAGLRKVGEPPRAKETP
jgi:hypothetical protein